MTKATVKIINKFFGEQQVHEDIYNHLVTQQIENGQNTILVFWIGGGSFAHTEWNFCEQRFTSMRTISQHHKIRLQIRLNLL